MCEPLTTALVIMAATTAVSAGGTLYAGEQQRKAASYSADVAEQAARAAQERAAYDEEMHRERIRKTLSTIRSLYGKSGVDMTGTPLLALEETAAQGEMDALAIRYGGDVAAAQKRSEAARYKMQGGAARTSSYFQAGSTLLQGAGRMYGMTKPYNPDLTLKRT